MTGRQLEESTFTAILSLVVAARILFIGTPEVISVL